ncbi:hypothetical protein GUI51_13485 [Enterococcus mundtii]|uniref:DUF3284 domain-containing protein n=1 Tax=Enterococcus mundtii TaxID=53346 RepID=A0ABQ0VFJ3_ENTMU|nr:hypothetical protein [Enterococcus mundtii]EMF0110828.1 hypothetical protein [Enterococcus hirae]MZU11423.1 hypothetical protein [Bifidobacterium longum]GEN18581.1 hypothetical protein LAC02_18620 [Ligilactobacillus acidipiscis]AUB54414.1 hypothetical protein EM4838_15460 [Enterococcus mundtii]AUB54521.1 hypothetical protein EM4838_16045 [Enterococcus mundtii]
MENKRVNIFEQNRVKDNFFIEIPLDTEKKQFVTTTWTEKLLNLSKDPEMLQACTQQSIKQFFTQLFKNEILKSSNVKNNKAKVVMGETWVYTNFTIAVEGGGVVLTLVAVAAEIALIAVKEDNIAENSLRSEKHRAISKFATKNGGSDFGSKVTEIFQKLEAGESVRL